MRFEVDLREFTGLTCLISVMLACCCSPMVGRNPLAPEEASASTTVILGART